MTVARLVLVVGLPESKCRVWLSVRRRETKFFKRASSSGVKASLRKSKTKMAC